MRKSANWNCKYVSKPVRCVQRVSSSASVRVWRPYEYWDLFRKVLTWACEERHASWLLLVWYYNYCILTELWLKGIYGCLWLQLSKKPHGKSVYSSNKKFYFPFCLLSQRTTPNDQWFVFQISLHATNRNQWWEAMLYICNVIDS